MRRALASGSEVAGYRIESLLGEGATGVVYLAREAAGRAVALKVLDPALAADARYRERFLRESGIAAYLEHPGIVPVLDAGEDDGLLYLAMEWVDGRDLRAQLRAEGPLEPEQAVAIVAEVAGGLDAIRRERDRDAVARPVVRRLVGDDDDRRFDRWPGVPAVGVVIQPAADEERADVGERFPQHAGARPGHVEGVAAARVNGDLTAAEPPENVCATSFTLRDLADHMEPLVQLDRVLASA